MLCYGYFLFQFIENPCMDGRLHLMTDRAAAKNGQAFRHCLCFTPFSLCKLVTTVSTVSCKLDDPLPISSSEKEGGNKSKQVRHKGTRSLPDRLLEKAGFLWPPLFSRKNTVYNPYTTVLYYYCILLYYYTTVSVIRNNSISNFFWHQRHGFFS